MTCGITNNFQDSVAGWPEAVVRLAIPKHGAGRIKSFPLIPKSGTEKNPYPCLAIAGPPPYAPRHHGSTPTALKPHPESHQQK